MNLTAIDVETELISYEHPVPEVICLSHAGHVGNNVGLTEADFGEKFEEFLENDTSIVGHNIAFDLSVLCYQYPNLWKPVFKAYDEGRVYDTLMRERLLRLTTNGDFNVLYDGHLATKIPGYKLCDLEKNYLGIDRSELKSDPNSPRFNYASLKGVPVSNWDKEAYTYSLDDSINCLAIYEAQEVLRKNCISETGYDPYAVEHFRVKVAFALRLLECRGERVDPEMILKVTKEFKDMYDAPELIAPLVEAGLLVLGLPEMPYAKGTKVHTIECIHHKEHPDYKVSRKQKCECPPKMKAGTDDKMPTKELHKYIWGLAYQGAGVEAWPASKCKGLERRMLDGKMFSWDYIDSTNGVLPAKMTLQADEEWTERFADKDPLLQKYVERKKLAKICTDYLPKFYQEDGKPAEILRCAFFPLKKTGRSSSKAPMYNKKLTYPGRNGQNVHPMIRPCTIPREGNIFISTDYSGMELATLAQKCIELFGKSVLADKINAGDDTHAYLGSQIALKMDVNFSCGLKYTNRDIDNPDDVFDAFMKCKGSDIVMRSDKHATWGDLFKFYRKFAKPTGLGFPGGLGPATMVVYAKGTYKVDLTLELATQLRQIWLNTYPEMGQYLTWIKNHCRDPQHAAQYEKKDGKKRLRQFYCYDTPFGMHRARADFCACANGAGLQSPSAEGALGALYQVQKAMTLANMDDSICSYLEGCYPINFIHDEILWECPDDEYVDARVEIVDRIMVECMEIITPNVTARTESSAMRRWYKQAEPVYNEGGGLIPWEPEKE